MNSLKIVAGKHWSEKDARRVVAAWRRSGESIRAFAVRHGFVRQRLYYWTQRLESPPAGTPAPQFVPAVVREVNGSGSVRIRIGNVSIEIDAPAVSPEWAASLIAKLSAPTCS